MNDLCGTLQSFRMEIVNEETWVFFPICRFHCEFRALRSHYIFERPTTYIFLLFDLLATLDLKSSTYIHVVRHRDSNAQNWWRKETIQSTDEFIELFVVFACRFYTVLFYGMSLAIGTFFIYLFFSPKDVRPTMTYLKNDSVNCVVKIDFDGHIIFMQEPIVSLKRCRYKGVLAVKELLNKNMKYPKQWHQSSTWTFFAPSHNVQENCGVIWVKITVFDFLCT